MNACTSVTNNSSETSVSCKNASECKEIIDRDNSEIKHDLYCKKIEKGLYSISQQLDTICMIKSEADGKYKQTYINLLVLESVYEEKINIKYFSSLDSVICIKEAVALVKVSIPESKYEYTEVVDRELMKKEFIFYDSHNNKKEVDELFFRYFTFTLPVKVIIKNEDCVEFEYAFGIPYTNKIYGTTQFIYSAGYESIGNNAINMLHGN